LAMKTWRWPCSRHEDLEVAVLEKKEGCWNCGQEGHRRSQCKKPKKKIEQTQQAAKREAPLTCSKCNKRGHSARQCVCGYCMKPGHDTVKCFKKQKDDAVFP